MFEYALKVRIIKIKILIVKINRKGVEYL